MEVTIDVSRKFNVNIEQFKQYLLNNGWERDVEYYDSLSRFKSIKRPAYQIMFPSDENVRRDEKTLIVRAVKMLATYLSDDIESTLERIYLTKMSQ